MNWGNKIAIVFSFFVAFILYLVYQTTQQNIDLVTEDYYAQEIAYQTKIDKMNNTNLLEQQVSFIETQTEIKVNFPTNLIGTIEGEIHFYNPLNKLKDVKIPITKHSETISKSKLNRGLHTIKINWKNNNKEYYSEEKLFIQ